MTMKLKAAVISSRARFNRLCKNYALRIMQIPKNHPIRLRVSASYPPYNNETELDWEKYLDWNEKNQATVTEIAETSSNSESEQRHRRKRRKVKRKSKKEVSQLFKITSKIAELLSSLKTERIKQKWNASWTQNLTSLINIQISELNKKKITILYHNKIQKILKNNRNNNNIILYSDESKNEQLNKLKADIIYIINLVTNQSFSWNLESEMKVFDAELFAIEKVFEIAFNNR